MGAPGSNQGREVAIVGAGIGGLAAALCLARCGARVVVLERAEALREVGAGIQIGPNGHRVLRALGLEVGDRSEAVLLRDGRSGRRVARLALPGPDGPHWRLCHRADLLAALAGACEAEGVEVRTGCAVARVAATDRRPILETAAGERMAPDLLVGADGVRSVVGAVLDEGGAARFTGQTAWRALVRVPDPPPPRAEIHLFPGRHVVTYPLRGGSRVNFVAVVERDEWVAEGWDAPDDPDRLRAAFPDAARGLRRLLGAVEETRLWGLHLHPVAEDLGSRGIALVGDAGHPTLPFMAQGANLALEDAWVLAAETDRDVSLDRGLRRYGERRHERVLRAVEAARANGRDFHLGGWRRALAHAALRAGSVVAPWAITRRTAWLHDHDVTEGAVLPPRSRGGRPAPSDTDPAASRA